MPFPLTFAIEGPKLVLRSPKREDIPHIFSATRHPGFHDGMLWEAPEHPDELVPTLDAHLTAWKQGEAFGFAIENKESGKFLGRISIRPTQEVHCWDLGYWTHPEVQGKGIMTEAVGLVARFAFDQLEAESLVAAYATWNKASQRVLEKNGFVYLKHIPKGFKKKGKWVAENMMIKKKRHR